MKRFLLAAVLVGAGQGWASTCVVGFTRDGSTLLLLDLPEEMSDQPARVRARTLATGAEQVFEPVEAGAKCVLADIASDAFTAWLARHPAVDARPSRRAPDGQAMAEVVVGAANASGAWTEGTWRAQSGAAWQLSVSRGGVTRKAGQLPAGGALVVYWAPGGKRTAWFRHTDGTSMRDPGSDELVVGTDGSPSVSVLAPRAKWAAGQAALTTLAGAGFVPLGLSEPKKERPGTTVFVSKGSEADGARAAALFPGAKVEPMSWASPFDVVVLLGTGK